MTSVLSLTRLPTPPLRPFVAKLWYFQGVFPHRLERILPSPSMQLIVNLEEDELRSYHGDRYRDVTRTRGAAIDGVTTRHFAIDTAEQRRCAGVSFHPGGASVFFGAPADAFADDTVELEAVWGARGRSLRARLLEERSPSGALDVLERDLLATAQSLAPNRMIIEATRALAAAERVGTVLDRVGMARSSFVRRFTAAVGVGPKHFARLARFRRVLASPPSSWAHTATLCGYHDQAHLIHDFRAFSGLTPALYVPRSSSELSHVPI